MPVTRTGARPDQYFPGWQVLGRNVKRGERALLLCMPITRKRRDEESDNNNDETNGAPAYTAFVYKPRWFVVSQTSGEEFTPARMPEWDAERALAALDLEQIPFTATDGNCQGYARLCCRQHNRAYVAKSVMWRSALLVSAQPQTSEPNAT